MAFKRNELDPLELIKVFLGIGKDEEGVIYKNNRLLKSKDKSLREYIVDEGTEVICDGAFEGNKNLTNIILPESLNIIGNNVFKGCKNLSSVTLPNNLEEIGRNALPKEISQIHIKGTKLKNLRESSFEDELSNSKNPKEEQSQLLITASYSLFNSLKSDLKDFANIKNLNTRPIADAGFNKEGEILTYANLKLQIRSHGVKLVSINNFEDFIVADHWTECFLEVTDNNDNVIFSDNNIIIDGNINGFEIENKFYFNNLSEERKEYFNLDTYNAGSFFHQLIKNYFKNEYINTGTNNINLVVDIFNIPHEANFNIQFKIRLRSGQFDSSKLNFVFFSNKKGKGRGNLATLWESVPYILNFISYDNQLYEGEFNIKTIYSSFSCENINLNAEIKRKENSFVSYIHITERDSNSKDGVINWFDKPEKLDVIVDAENMNLATRQDSTTKKWGFVSQYDDKWIVDPQYDKVRDFEYNMAAVKKRGKWGFINKKGERIVAPRYDDVKDFYKNAAIVKLNNKWGIVNNKGKIILEPQYKYINDFQDDIARTEVENKYGHTNYGFVNLKGELICEPTFENARDFSEGRAAVETEINGKGYYAWGYINKHGVMVIKPKWYNAGSFSEGLAAVGKMTLGRTVAQYLKTGDVDDTEEVWGYIDLDGNVKIKPQYYIAEHFWKGAAKVYKTEKDYEKDKFHYIDKEGKPTEEPISELGRKIRDGEIIVKSVSWIDRQDSQKQ